VSSFFVLFKKEFRGQLRTYRLLIVVAVFFIFGLGTPLMLKYLYALVPAENVAISIPEFTSADAVKSFISSLGQLGLIAAILVAMGSVATERESGTVAMTLSKPVGCGSFILAKLAALAVTFGVAIAVGAAGCYLYTVVLFGNPGGFDFFIATMLGARYLLFCLAVTVMYSSFVKSPIAAGGLSLVTLAAIAGTASLPGMKHYSPGALVSWAEDVAAAGGPNSWWVLVVSVVLIILTTVIGWQVFKRKEL
jgi:ABC-2 type transport system permease protein